MILALLACAAPDLAATGPTGVVAGDVQLTVISSAAQVSVSVDGGAATVHPPGAIVLDARSWTDGPHALTVWAGGFPSRRAEAVLIVTTDHSGPQISLEGDLSVEQGHTLAVVVRTDEPADLTLSVFDRERRTWPIADRTARALIGVPIRADVGAHPLRLTATDALGNTRQHTAEVRVVTVDWPFTGKLPMSRAKAAVDPEGVVRMRAERDAVYALQTPDAQWTGPFRLPLEGTHTSAFGSFREYPDGTRSHHDAEDIARRPGLPVHAPAAGRVALARAQEVHGNAVLLDHGQGVVSLYSHLASIAVSEGDRVQTGDELGRVGSTGRSTGPHLHWGVVVDGVPVDPMQWTQPAPWLQGGR